MRKAVNAQIIVIHLPKATKANLLSESNSSRIKRHLAFFKYITIFRLVAPVVQWIGHNPAKIVTPVRLRVRANLNGRLAERSKAHVWSTCIRVTVSRVRIPNLPKLRNGNQLSFFLFSENVKIRTILLFLQG